LGTRRELVMQVSNKIELKDLYDDIEIINNKFTQLSIDTRIEVVDKTAELYTLEPKRRGRPPTGFVSRYDRLSTASKIEVTNYINKILKDEIKMNKSSEKVKSKSVATNNVSVIDFKRAVAKRREERLLRDSFVAYETNWCFGVRGYLRHKFNCKDKSKDNLDNLIQDMEMALKRMASEETIKNDPRYRQCANSKELDIPISQTVTEAQKRILRRIQDTCESELFIDLCNDNTIRIKNNWNACLIFEYIPSNGEIMISGNNLDVENYLRGLNAYF
jgi:hypothetical protein